MIQNADRILTKLCEEKRAAFEYQRRRHPDWDENYALYRNHVQINRLTQRQPVCVPLVKETVRTIQSRIDDKPDIYFENLAGDMDQEIVLNSCWEDFYRNQNIELVDKVEKRQVLLFGRGHKKLNWCNGRVECELKDIYDVLIDPKVKPHDTESARFIVELNIFKPLGTILVDEKYDADARKQLETLYTPADADSKETKMEVKGQAIQNGSQEVINARNQRMQDIGWNDPDDFAASHTLVELSQHFTLIWDSKVKKYVRYVCVYAMDSVLLLCMPLKKAIGVEFWPFESWADDLEANDYWSDSVADVLRVPNQIANIWYSQEMENRTLANYGMNFYDSTIEGFEPPQIEPRPGGWYPLPGKPNEVYQRVDVRPFAGNLEAIQFVMNMADRAVAASAIEKGGLSPERRTLGEIEIAVGKAEQRISSITPYYRLSWKRFAEKWLKMMEANSKEGKTAPVFKKGYDGRYWKKEVKRSDWFNPQGYRVQIMNETQRRVNNVDTLNQLFAVRKEFSDNQALNDVIRKRALIVAELTPEEVRAIDEWEKKNRADRGAGAGPNGERPPVMPVMPKSRPPAAALPMMSMERAPNPMMQPETV